MPSLVGSEMCIRDRIGQGLFAKKTPTRMFNGYEEEVAGLYEGMDLVKYH